MTFMLWIISWETSTKQDWSTGKYEIFQNDFKRNIKRSMTWIVGVEFILKKSDYFSISINGWPAFIAQHCLDVSENSLNTARTNIGINHAILVVLITFAPGIIIAKIKLMKITKSILSFGSVRTVGRFDICTCVTLSPYTFVSQSLPNLLSKKHFTRGPWEVCSVILYLVNRC